MRMRPESKLAFEEEDKKNPEEQSQCFKTYCEETSLHGWQYLVASIHAFWRIHWGFVVFVSICVAIFFAVTAAIEFHGSSVITTIDSLNVPLSEVYFPAITLCNINQVRRSFFASIGIDGNFTMTNVIFEQLYQGTDHEPTEEEYEMLLQVFTNEAYLRRKYENQLFDYDDIDLDDEAAWQDYLAKGNAIFFIILNLHDPILRSK